MVDAEVEKAFQRKPLKEPLVLDNIGQLPEKLQEAGLYTPR